MANELKMAKEVTEAANKELEAFCTQFHTIYLHHCGELMDLAWPYWKIIMNNLTIPGKII